MGFTKFEYGNIRLFKKRVKKDGKLEFSLEITNIGKSGMSDEFIVI